MLALSLIAHVLSRDRACFEARPHVIVLTLRHNPRSLRDAHSLEHDRAALSVIVFALTVIALALRRDGTRFDA